MKITGIEIGEYRQFKNIKFDFTYPKDHPKAGQPLEKVCFIGQSGTGKTTLLNVIWDLMQEINKASRTEVVKNNGHQLDNYMAEPIFDIKYYLDIEGTLLLFDRNHEIQKSDKDFFNDWFSKKLSVTHQYKIIGTNKLCLFIKDSIAHEADAFLVNQEVSKQSFNDFIKTDLEVAQEKERKNGIIDIAGRNRVISLGERQSIAIWRHLFRSISDYDDTGKNLILGVVQNSQSFSAELLIKKLAEWKTETFNPRVDLAENCLNPLLSNFFLEVDIENAETLLTLKSKQGTKFSNSTLSTGTRQLLATAIPLYKFDTTDTVILFDEPERSLFPDIQRGLIDYYISLAPTAQFFFATHSPIIASAFEPCERFILYFDENGEVRFHNGVAPEGDDPNDILSEDFGLEELMLPKGLEEYKRYRRLAVEIRNEKDAKRKDELIIERAKLGDLYRF